MEKYKIASVTRIGGRSENQDFYRIEETQFGLLAIVCDGMGGANGGRIAAEMAADTIWEEIKRTRNGDAISEIVSAISQANAAIFRESNNNNKLRGMGTTVAVLLINEDHAICFHVGDSRIYQFRSGNIKYRTFDHSVVFEAVKLGIMTEEEARVSPKSNIITRAVGIMDKVGISVSEALPYKEGDRFLLCTDGIWGAVPEAQLTKMVSPAQPIETVINKLADDIDAIGTEKGRRHDNLTAIIIEMQAVAE